MKEYDISNKYKYKIIFEDRASGKYFEILQYKALKEMVKTGDTIIIKELDRLRRNFMNTPNELQHFVKRNIKVITPDTTLVSTGYTKLDYTINNCICCFLVLYS